MSVWETLGFGKGKEADAPVQQVQLVAPVAETKVEETPAPMTSQADWFKPADTDAKGVEFDPTTLFDTDPAKLQEAIGNLNFMQGMLTPDVMSKIEAGGQEGVQATLQLVNKSNQNVMAAAMQASAKMVESAVAKVTPVMDQKVTQHLRQQSVEATLKEANPVFASPAGEFMLTAVRDAMMKKYPNATSAELKDNAQQFIQDIITVGSPVKAAEQKDIMATNWGDFLTAK